MASGERSRLRATAGSAVLRIVASSACIKKAAAAMAGSPTSLCKEKVITYAALSSQFALWVSDGPEICSLSFVSLLHSEKRCCLQAVPGGICSPFLSLPFFFRRGLVPEERALFPLNIRNGPEPKRGSEEKGKALSREATRAALHWLHTIGEDAPA